MTIKRFWEYARVAIKVTALFLGISLIVSMPALVMIFLDTPSTPVPTEASEGDRILAQVNTAAWCLWTEARGEPAEGREAVMSVILNRSEREGKSFVGVVFRPHQFSGVGKYVPEWFKDGPYGNMWPAEYQTPADIIAYFECMHLSQRAFEGDFKSIGPWTHYYANGKCNPYWGYGLQEVQIIGNHTFGVTN